jgi:hypothetical protein
MSFVNNVRIVSDGTATGTKVLTPDGRELACKAIRFSHNADEVPTVTLELIGVQVELDMLRKTKGRE